MAGAGLPAAAAAARSAAAPADPMRTAAARCCEQRPASVSRRTTRKGSGDCGGGGDMSRPNTLRDRCGGDVRPRRSSSSVSASIALALTPEHASRMARSGAGVCPRRVTVSRARFPPGCADTLGAPMPADSARGGPPAPDGSTCGTVIRSPAGAATTGGAASRLARAVDRARIPTPPPPPPPTEVLRASRGPSEPMKGA